MRTRAVFNPRPRPRTLAFSSDVSAAASGTPVGVNPNVSPIPPLVFDTTGEPRNLGAILTALKDVAESLTGQRGDPANRAVTFNDLVDYGVLTADALITGGNTPLAVVPAFFTPLDPAASSALGGVMMGTKMAFAAGVNGAFLVGATGNCGSGGSVGSTATIEVRAGTDGILPENGEAPRGVVIGAPVFVSEFAVDAKTNWAFTGVGLNYTPQAVVWLDFSLATDSGPASLGSINVTVLGV